jgi:hypothetical protein
MLQLLHARSQVHDLARSLGCDPLPAFHLLAEAVELVAQVVDPPLLQPVQVEIDWVPPARPKPLEGTLLVQPGWTSVDTAAEIAL